MGVRGSRGRSGYQLMGWEAVYGPTGLGLSRAPMGQEDGEDRPLRGGLHAGARVRPPRVRQPQLGGARLRLPSSPFASSTAGPRKATIGTPSPGRRCSAKWPRPSPNRRRREKTLPPGSADPKSGGAEGSAGGAIVRDYFLSNRPLVSLSATVRPVRRLRPVSPSHWNSS